MIELGPPVSELQEIYRNQLQENEPELTEEDIDELVDEKQYYRGDASE